MDKAVKIQYDSIDVLKGLACIGVVWMHCGFPGTTGKVIIYCFKFAVPIFFMISGFFLYAQESRAMLKKLDKRIPHIASLLLFSFLFYGFYSFVENCILNGITPNVWLEQSFPWPESAIKIFFGTFFCGPAWFLYAQLWSYIVLRVVLQFVKIEKLYPAIPLLLICHVVLRTIVRKADLSWYRTTYFRTFLLYGIPFILMGALIAQHKSLFSISRVRLLIFAGLGCVLQFAEYALTRVSLDFYFGTVIYSIALFSLAIQIPKFGANSFVMRMGRNYSMPIYIIHVFVIGMIQNLWLRLDAFIGLPGWSRSAFLWIYPILSICGSYLIAILFVKIKMIMKKEI